MIRDFFKKKFIFRNAVLIIKRLFNLGGFKVNYYFDYKPLRCCYVSIHKNANSTIHSILQKKIGIKLNKKNYNSIHHNKINFSINKEKFYKMSKKTFTFTFTRDPLDRLLSCYKNKIIDEDYERITDGYFGLIKKNMSFDSFVDAICLIPDMVADGHFKSQTSIISPFLFKKIKYDFIGKIENFDNDIKIIVDKFNLEKPAEVNKSLDDKGIKDYYTQKTALKVFKRYKKDFNKLGYTDDFKKIYNELKS